MGFRQPDDAFSGRATPLLLLEARWLEARWLEARFLEARWLPPHG